MAADGRGRSLGSFGEKIGEGFTADIHAWAPGQVLKLFKPHVGLELARYEGRLTRALFARGIAVPEMHGEETLDGRYGIVLSRLDGPTLLELWRTDVMTTEEVGATLASLCMEVHEAPPPRAMSLRDWMDVLLREVGHTLPEAVAGGVWVLVDRLPAADRLCHCDVHPGNVIMTVDGPRLIDWTGAKLGTAALDLATCHLMLSELVPESFGDPARQAALDAALQAQYARLAGISTEALTEAMRPYLSVIRPYVILMGAVRPAARQRLIGQIEAELRAEGLL